MNGNLVWLAETVVEREAGISEHVDGSHREQ